MRRWCLTPRVKKALFSSEWNDGKPKREATKAEAERSPRIVKYYRIESYDDALENIEFDEERGEALNIHPDYVPQYMLQEESANSLAFANVEALKKPFAYELRRAGDGAAGKTMTADLPETFAYLVGLRERTRRVCEDKKARGALRRPARRLGRQGGGSDMARHGELESERL